MSRGINIYLKAIRKNILLIAFFILLISVTIVVSVSRSNIAFASSPEVASVNVVSGVIKGDEFAALENSSYNLKNASSNSTSLVNECAFIDASSSLCYVYTLRNITISSISLEFKFNPVNTRNFCIKYSMNGVDFNALDVLSFTLSPDEEATVYITVSIDDLTIDASLDGFVDILAAQIAE